MTGRGEAGCQVCNMGSTKIVLGSNKLRKCIKWYGNTS